MNAAESFVAMARGGELALSLPAGGATPERHRRLFELARCDVALARLAEAHTDAVAILHEAERSPPPEATYGVWAAEDPSAQLVLGASASGAWRLDGEKAFCTGAGIVDRALVTVGTTDGVRLVDVDLHRPTVTFDHRDWVATAFAETRTARATFDAHPVGESDLVGGPAWYLTRVGFWHGACGPAACWAGGAAGLVDGIVAGDKHRPAEPHRDAHVGALVALRWRLVAGLARAGQEIDESPSDAVGAQVRALALRHDVERAATEILDRAGRATGPRPLAFDADVIRRVNEVALYIRQCHGERDLEQLGRAALGREPA